MERMKSKTPPQKRVFTVHSLYGQSENVLKGKVDGTVDIVVKGGIPDKYEKEQLEALGNMPDMPPLGI